MNSRERVLAALNNEQPDRVPIFELWISESSYFGIAKILGLDVNEFKGHRDMHGEECISSKDVYCTVIEKLELDATSSEISTGLRHISEDRAINKYGVIQRLSEHAEPYPVEGPIKEPSDLKGFDMVSKLAPEDFAGIEHVIGRVGSDKAHFVQISDPFQISWVLRGAMQNLLRDYIRNPQLVHDLARIAVDFQMAVIDKLLEMGVTVMDMNGDLAGEENTLMSPEHYREYIKPYQKKVVDYVHEKGARIIKHTDGNIWPILDDMVEIGFDGIHPFQPQCMDLGQVKKYLAGKACVIGNIDCRNLLPFGTEDEVERAVIEAIETAAAGGGYIISSSNSIHPRCKPENYVAMVKASHEYGTYD